MNSSVDTYGDDHDYTPKELQSYNEPIKSGESKFKVFSFEPAPKDKHDIEKCIDFWQFIETRNDLVASRSFKLTNYEVPTSDEIIKTTDPIDQQDVDWEEALAILKMQNLDKLAGVYSRKFNRTKYEAPMPNDEESFQHRLTGKHFEEDEGVEDTFDISELTSWDPLRKYFADKMIQTDPILTQDMAVQVRMKTATEVEKAHLETLYEDINGYVQQLAEIYRYRELDPECNKCIDCSCKIEEPRQVDKCICSCGQSKCLCTQLSQIVAEVQLANQQLQLLTEECGCYECACIYDCKFIINAQIDISILLDEHLKRDKQTSVCTCSNAPNCMCNSLKTLHEQITILLSECKFVMEGGDNLELTHVCYATIAEEERSEMQEQTKPTESSRKSIEKVKLPLEELKSTEDVMRCMKSAKGSIKENRKSIESKGSSRSSKKSSASKHARESLTGTGRDSKGKTTKASSLQGKTWSDEKSKTIAQQLSLECACTDISVYAKHHESFACECMTGEAKPNAYEVISYCSRPSIYTLSSTLSTGNTEDSLTLAETTSEIEEITILPSKENTKSETTSPLSDDENLISFYTNVSAVMKAEITPTKVISKSTEKTKSESVPDYTARHSKRYVERVRASWGIYNWQDPNYTGTMTGEEDVQSSEISNEIMQGCACKKKYVRHDLPEAPKEDGALKKPYHKTNQSVISSNVTLEMIEFYKNSLQHQRSMDEDCN